MAEQRIGLITGASRGIGAATARILGARGYHVVVNYREKAKRAQHVADEITAAGGTASIVRADVTDPADVTAMLGEVHTTHGRLDTLVLNASGGLELGADPGYALRINRDAPRDLVDAALPLMPAGARVVFVTSHQAHFVATRDVPAAYRPVATSKRAGEDEIRSRATKLATHGIGLSVVSGDMVDGTIVVRLLERRDPAAVDARRNGVPLPTVEEFATAVADEAARPGIEARTVFVGGSDYLT